jgi:hypothetical protein
MACEAMPRKHDRVLVIRQHVLDLFLKRPARNRHGFAGEVVQPLPAYLGSQDSTSAWDVECELVGAGLQVSTDIA